MSLNYYVIDIETSGLSSIIHEPTEISIIRCSDKVQITRNIKCLHPERANADALRITNKTLEDLSYGDDLIDVVNLCDKFLNEDGLTRSSRVIVGHNIISFDKKFLYKMWATAGKEFPANLYLDTISLIRVYAKREGIKTRKFNLHAACDMVGIKKYAAAHGSKVDTRNNYLLWKNLIEDKNINYLPFIKNHPHYLNGPPEEEPDMSILEED
jgi:DNA polymerase III epsilon subunit-like protein